MITLTHAHGQTSLTQTLLDTVALGIKFPAHELGGTHRNYSDHTSFFVMHFLRFGVFFQLRRSQKHFQFMGKPSRRVLT